MLVSEKLSLCFYFGNQRSWCDWSTLCPCRPPPPSYGEPPSFDDVWYRVLHSRVSYICTLILPAHLWLICQLFFVFVATRLDLRCTPFLESGSAHRPRCVCLFFFFVCLFFFFACLFFFFVCLYFFFVCLFFFLFHLLPVIVFFDLIMFTFPFLSLSPSLKQRLTGFGFYDMDDTTEHSSESLLRNRPSRVVVAGMWTLLDPIPCFRLSKE